MPEDAHRMRSATRSAIQPRCLCGEPWPCRYAVTDPMPSWTTGRWLCALCRAWGDGGADGLDDHHQRKHKEGEGS